MRDCPKCLAPNAYKKIHKDSYISYICEYCGSAMEDTMFSKKEKLLQSQRIMLRKIGHLQQQ